jgi:hypothetical protein
MSSLPDQLALSIGLLPSHPKQDDLDAEIRAGADVREAYGQVLLQLFSGGEGSDGQSKAVDPLWCRNGSG